MGVYGRGGGGDGWHELYRLVGLFARGQYQLFLGFSTDGIVLGYAEVQAVKVPCTNSWTAPWKCPSVAIKRPGPGFSVLPSFRFTLPFRGA